jgi:ELWxxDGT repeat protein
VRPGLASSNPSNLVDVGGTLFFAADDGTNGVELWKSAGTAATTTLVKDINPNGSDSSNPAGLTNVAGTLFFRANDGTNGNELWTSDGTTAGTVLVLDIKPGALGSTPASLINGNGTLFFTADDGTNGAELWQSDGTPGGTLLVTDIRPGAEGSLPDGLFAVGRTLFFRADDGTNGTELWKADLPNAKPIANADSFTFTPGVALVVAAPGVLANDTDAEGSPLTAVLVTGPTNGVLVLNADGSFSYTPNAGFRGSDSFTYQANDGTDSSVQAAEVTLASQDFGFIERLYIDLLGRSANQVSNAEVTFWIGQLTAGATRVQVVQAFQGSAEYRVNLINGFYQEYLGRPADPGALSFFGFHLSQGLSIEALQAILLASNEYFLNAGTDAIFVESLYDDLLGRTASVQETGFWRQQLFNGVSRFSVARAFLATNEYRVRLVNQLYQDLLERPVDAPALSFWLAQMQLGLSRQTLQLVLASSNEYFLLS